MRRSGAKWKHYERHVAALFSDHQSDIATVATNVFLQGCITGIQRQIDVLIDARLGDDVTRRVVVDAKCRRRKIDVKDVEEFEGMMRDVRAHRGIIVCTNGFTPAAERRAQRAITIRIVEEPELVDLDFRYWDPCLGHCRTSAAKNSGRVLYDQPFGFAPVLAPVSGTGPRLVGAMSTAVVGKCDECSSFHVWCWECGSRFALSDDDSRCCGCSWMWLTAEMPEGRDRYGNGLRSVVLLLAVPGAPVPRLVDRRPLN
jgi:hypothetical protein